MDSFETLIDLTKDAHRRCLVLFFDGELTKITEVEENTRIPVGEERIGTIGKALSAVSLQVADHMWFQLFCRLKEGKSHHEMYKLLSGFSDDDSYVVCQLVQRTKGYNLEFKKSIVIHHEW